VTISVSLVTSNRAAPSSCGSTAGSPKCARS
jgi:hypothetical protein